MSDMKCNPPHPNSIYPVPSLTQPTTYLLILRAIACCAIATGMFLLSTSIRHSPYLLTSLYSNEDCTDTLAIRREDDIGQGCNDFGIHWRQCNPSGRISRSNVLEASIGTAMSIDNRPGPHHADGLMVVVLES